MEKKKNNTGQQQNSGKGVEGALKGKSGVLHFSLSLRPNYGFIIEKGFRLNLRCTIFVLVIFQ